MEIVIQRTVTKKVEETISINTPSFFKVKHAGSIAVYSEDKVVTVFNQNGYAAVSTGPYELQTRHSSGFGDEITEQEFNDQLAKALFLIAGVEICPTLALQSAS